MAKKRRLTRSAPGQVVPIVGRIAAGTPILAVENIEGGLVVDKDLFKGDEFFAVQVKGDSMIDDHILDGDYAILRKQTTAEKGDVVAVLVDEEVALKRFYPRGREVELRPANKRLRPLWFKANEVHILGKMVGLVRKIRSNNPPKVIAESSLDPYNEYGATKYIGLLKAATGEILGAIAHQDAMTLLNDR